MTMLEEIVVRAPGTIIGAVPRSIALPSAWMPWSLQQSPQLFPCRPQGQGFAGSNGGCDGIGRFSLATSSGFKSFKDALRGVLDD